MSKLFTEASTTNSIAWGDYDSDGDLDLAVSKQDSVVLYRNGRGMQELLGATPLVHISQPKPNANFYSASKIWTGGKLPITYTLYSPHIGTVQFIQVWYSLNGGGQWLPAVAASDTITSGLDTASYTSHSYLATPGSPIPDINTLTSTLTLIETNPIADIDVTLNLTHASDSDLVITLTAPFTRSVLLVNQRGGSGDNFTNTIFDDDAPTRIISGTAPFTGRYRPEQVFDRFVGYPADGEWALSISDQVTGNVGTLLSWGITVTLNTGAVHTYTWDVYESGFMGQSDNVVFRLVAIPAIENRPNQIPGPYLYGSYASHTFPFRVRGSQVRVLSDTVPAKDAVVYRLPVSETVSAEPYVSLSNEPFRTDGQGYLQGRGEIRRGDRLFAMLPITWTDSYTLYYTSGDPTLSGLDFYTVTALGVQTLTVSAANPLLLFDLDVSLEWDARNDEPYLTQLERDLQRASQVLYDLSNGQVALGNVRVFHAKEHWMDAHIVIRASNKARPIANLGGVVSVPTDDIVSPSSLTSTEIITNAYIPGQVRIGATWNRFGQPGGSLEEDWPRALAHELGHYLLFLQDNYLGVSEAGLLTHTDCRGSAMTDPYLESYSEFLDEATWTGECLYTLSEHTTGRADWETITAFYPMLRGTNTNRGPSDLPLDITQVMFVDPITPTTAMAAPFFSLSDDEGRPAVADNAQAYLFKLGQIADPTDDDVIPLGSPNRDLLLARGAAQGDRICVFDDTHAPPRVGCLDEVGAVATSFVLHPVPDWAPQILVTPINSRTFGITVSQVLTENLWVQVLPDSGPASTYLPMTKVGDKFTQTVTLPEPAFGSLVRVWVPNSAPHQEAVTRFALGEGWDGYSRGWPGYSRGWPGYSRGWPGYSRGWPAPVSSNDGQVIIFDLDNVLSPGADYALQTLASPPDLPAWLTPVGQTYRYDTNQVQTHTSILFKYLQRDVPEGQEYGLRVYYSPDEGQTWHRLPTELDTYRNLASAEVSENGIYVLISTVEMPPFTVGWNNFGYPVPGTRPVTDALVSIAGKYTSVYEYDSAPSSQWLLYDQTVVDRHPQFTDLVNDLTHFEFGRGYWLYATEPVTLYLDVGEASKMQATQNTPLPPTTFYGWIVPTDFFTPTVGMTITAWISDTLCGESAVSDWHQVGTMIQGWLPYKLQVKAADSTSSQCGTSGKTVTFRVGDTVMFTTQQWDNSQAWFHNLSDQVILYDIYLPLVIRKE
jgi:subtilisin-like proprotein convertase family protein